MASHHMVLDQRHSKKAPVLLPRQRATPQMPMAEMPGDVGADLAERFGITEQTQARRREFLRITDADRALMLRLTPWAHKNSAAMARHFYDWQVTFSATRDFFERFAPQKEHAGVGPSYSTRAPRLARSQK